MFSWGKGGWDQLAPSGDQWLARDGRGFLWSSGESCVVCVLFAVLPPVLTQLLQSVIFGMRGGFVPLDLFQVQLDLQQRRSPLCGYLFAL